MEKEDHLPSTENDRRYPERRWTWLDELPDVPPLGLFEEREEPQALRGFEDCDRYLRTGPYAIWRVRELAKDEPCPRTVYCTVTINRDGSEREATLHYGETRAPGWYASVDFTVEGDENGEEWFFEEVRDEYTVARACEDTTHVLKDLRNALSTLRRLGTAFPEMSRSATDGMWSFLATATDDDDRSVRAELSPWAFCRMALLFETPPEVLEAALGPHDVRGGFVVEYAADLIDQGFRIQDALAFDFCEGAYSMADGHADRLTYEMEIVAR